MKVVSTSIASSILMAVVALAAPTSSTEEICTKCTASTGFISDIYPNPPWNAVWGIADPVDGTCHQTTPCEQKTRCVFNFETTFTHPGGGGVSGVDVDYTVSDSSQTPLAGYPVQVTTNSNGTALLRGVFMPCGLGSESEPYHLDASFTHEGVTRTWNMEFYCVDCEPVRQDP